jgi:RNA polymerase sigma factor (sigma-70 family)
MGPGPADLLLSSQPDERLVSLVRGGNEQAFATIVLRYRRELYVRARRMRCDGRADDLVQQTFLSAFAALRSGTEVHHLRGWLYRILRNEVIRTSSGPILEVELDPASIASEPLEEASHRRMLALETLSSIAALPARQRHALVATALDGESRAAVAGSMGVSEGAVRQLMHRARATLRAAVAAITPGPLANCLAAIRRGTSDQGPEIAFAGGATSAAGVAIKLGAILATGAVATGIVGSQLTSRSGHPASARVQPKPVAAALGQAGPGGAGIPGRVEGTGVVALLASGIAGPAPGALRGPVGFLIGGSGQMGAWIGGVAGDDRNPGGDRMGASGRRTHATRGASPGDGGDGGGSPSGRGATEPARGGSSGRDGSGSGGGGSGVDGGSDPASGGGSHGDSSGANASPASAVSPSVDGGHDGGSSSGGTLTATGSSGGGTSSISGSSDGGSSDASGSDGGSSVTTGSSSSGG